MYVAILRTMLTCLTPRQIVQILPGAQQTYSRWIQEKLRGTTPKASTIMIASETTTLADGRTRLHWVKDCSTPPKVVILFFHGGGYNAPLSDGHLDWCYNMARETKSHGGHVAVALLEYGLTPAHTYPTQLRQARDALQHLLQMNINPANIVIGGDSAGANLALGLLSHIMHPHPAIEPIDMAQPLGGAFLISPWLTADTSTNSFREKADIDMLSPALVRRSAKDFLPPDVMAQEMASGEGWALAMAAPNEWWTDLGAAVDELYVTVGEHEMFRDHVVDFVQMLKHHQGIQKTRGANVRFEVGKGEVHDHILTLHLRRAAANPPLERLLEWLRLVFE